MIYDYKLTTGTGDVIDLADYKGKVILIVNTATGCGFTSQYSELAQWYNDYHDKGLEILDIPCNQFGRQAPGTDEEIHAFCTLNYKTPYKQMKKSDVNGETAIPLFKYLKEQKGFAGFGKGPAALAMSAMLKKIDKDYKNNPEIKWNFTKFVVDRNGNVVARFEPTENMDNVDKYVERVL